MSNRQDLDQLLQSINIDPDSPSWFPLMDAIIEKQKAAYSQGWNDAYGLEGFHHDYNSRVKTENLKEYEI